MNRTTTFTIAGAVAMLTCAAASHAGVVNYTIHGDTSDASLGDTVTLSVNAIIDPDGATFSGLAAASFNILSDDIPAGGSLDISSPGLGLAPDFIAAGSPGAIVGNDIIGVTAGQFPDFINPNINDDTNLTLFTFQYTVDDDTPRAVTFDLGSISSQIYAGSGPGGSAIYTSSSNAFIVNVSSVPAPGAAALLGLAGVIGRRRRRSS